MRIKWADTIHTIAITTSHRGLSSFSWEQCSFSVIHICIQLKIMHSISTFEASPRVGRNIHWISILIEMNSEH